MIKPYVSGNRGTWEVLNSKGKVAATFANIDVACLYLNANWDALCKARKARK